MTGNSSNVWMNDTLSLLCAALYEDAGLNVTNPLCCPFVFDGFRNWTMARANTIAVQKCPAKSNNKEYNENENSTRSCLPNGVWSQRSNYDKCIITKELRYHVLTTWFIGYTLSTIALIIALVLLRYFRALRCLRNEIHCNLIISFIVRVFIWYIQIVPHLITSKVEIVVVNITTIIYLFSQLANFFWMFVEGLYLFTIIVWTYGIEKFKIRHYSIIGWGIPFILSTVAAISITIKTSTKINWFLNPKINQIKLIVIHIPILISIICNVFILGVIIFTVFNKLKQTKIPLARRSSKLALFSTEYRKSIKAAVVLIPLLGISHCLFLFQPQTIRYPDVYQMFNAVLTSTQGFFVALIYGFLNREVKFVIKAKYRSFCGYLPNASRSRQTLDDSVGPVRRGNSAFRPHKPDNDHKVFNCRSYRFPKPDNCDTNIPIVTCKENQEI